MKRILICTGAAAAVIAAAVVLLLCTCIFGNHVYTAATCTEPARCVRCGAERGEPLGHTGSKATCEQPGVCTRCGKRLSEPLGHVRIPATCDEAEQCARCGMRRGEPLGHIWDPATCTEPETCSRCKKSRGEPLGHSMTEPTFQTRSRCTRCGYTEGEPLPAALEGRALHELRVGEPAAYTTAGYADPDAEVTGTVGIVDYRVIAGDGTFPAREGYEWHIATVQLVFSGDDARQHGAQSAWTYGDWYLCEDRMTAADGEGFRAFAADWYGTLVTCRQKTAPASEAGWYDRELRFCWEEGVQVPEGYDGVLLIFYPCCGTELAAGEALEHDALVFRMR